MKWQLIVRTSDNNTVVLKIVRINLDILVGHTCHGCQGLPADLVCWNYARHHSWYSSLCWSSQLVIFKYVLVITVGDVWVYQTANYYLGTAGWKIEDDHCLPTSQFSLFESFYEQYCFYFTLEGIVIFTGFHKAWRIIPEWVPWNRRICLRRIGWQF